MYIIVFATFLLIRAGRCNDIDILDSLIYVYYIFKNWNMPVNKNNE